MTDQPADRPAHLPHPAGPPEALPAVPAGDPREDPAWRLATAFVLSRRSAHTRRAYARDIRDFYTWCAQAGLDPLRLRRVHIDAYAHELAQPGPRTGRPAAESTIARKLSTLAGLYAYAVGEDVLDRSPMTGVIRPRTTQDSVSTGLDRDEVAALLSAAAADGTRAHALISLLVHNGLRIDEALSRDVEHLQTERGHQVLRLRRKGGHTATAPLAPPVVHALTVYLAGRTSGPLFSTRTGRRVDEPAAWRLIRRLARRAGLPQADRINPHSLRHTFVTAALDAGVSLRDVQDGAGHRDPRTTRRYDSSRHNLDRHPSYAVSTFYAAGRSTETTGRRDS
ncbi:MULTISPECIES: tyrosine-type recombinase/integrase [Pseudonocardia]|uniref:tyrosine-type recombinase/integrase n=1 Tax=Pseudonocardia TaxID=1847 RepID=UPI001E36753C|nr:MULTISPECIES: tyrosine-type recombinase/integrase [Pseudonocardia]